MFVGKAYSNKFGTDKTSKFYLNYIVHDVEYCKYMLQFNYFITDIANPQNMHIQFRLKTVSPSQSMSSTTQRSLK